MSAALNCSLTSDGQDVCSLSPSLVQLSMRSFHFGRFPLVWVSLNVEAAAPQPSALIFHEFTGVNVLPLQPPHPWPRP